MKAIIVLKKGSYAQYFGQTFDVKEVLSTMIALNVNGQTTDFSFSEVLIVDVAQYINVKNVPAYCKANKIKI